MMIKRIATFFSLVFSITAFGEAPINCEIESWGKIYTPSNVHFISNSKIFKRSTCPSSIENKVKNIMLKTTGYVTANFILREVKEEGLTLNITPQRIRLFKLTEEIERHILKDSSSRAVLGSLSKKMLLTLEENDSVEFTCEQCKRPGNHGLKIEITNPVNQIEKKLWTDIIIQEKVNVFFFSKNVPSQSSDLANFGLYEKQIYTTNPNNYFVNQKELSFYKTTRNLNKNVPIQRSDLFPKNLIKPNAQVKVIFKQGTISISRNATSTQYGKLNDSIKMRIKNNKFIVGRVIDYNKVKVE
jgi:flagella basal body P-ring formation protein FlgA